MERGWLFGLCTSTSSFFTDSVLSPLSTELFVFNRVPFSLLCKIKAPKVLCEICYLYPSEGSLFMPSIFIHLHMLHISFLDLDVWALKNFHS